MMSVGYRTRVLPGPETFGRPPLKKCASTYRPLPSVENPFLLFEFVFRLDSDSGEGTSGPIVQSILAGSNARSMSGSFRMKAREVSRAVVKVDTSPTSLSPNPPTPRVVNVKYLL